jgi:ABC-2 type transport system ATP-binding protein
MPRHNPTDSATPVLIAKELRHAFRPKKGPLVQALDGISIAVRPGELTALIGPDGSGKTTLIRLAAGLLRADSGTLTVLGFDVAVDPQSVQDRISYMPQRFGLYEDLSVAENLDLYADLYGVTKEQRAQRYPQLMEMTALAPFKKRLAGKLSGGMKQKLGLACTLVRSPELLFLDEPTVGVDPLSRRELWEIVHHLVTDEGMTVLLSTAYLDEAEHCSHVVLLHQGKILSQGTPSKVTQNAAGLSYTAQPSQPNGARALQAQLLDRPDIIDAVPDGGRVRFVRATDGQDAAATDALLRNLGVTPVPASFEDGFMVLLRQSTNHEQVKAIKIDQPVIGEGRQIIVNVHDLVKRFGDFNAVDHINFEVRRGEIFGLLGPNGAGKTTTFRMMCGLLTASGGELHIAGTDVRRAPASARSRLGYVAQKFSLYGPLTVTENLEFFASAYGLRGERRRARIDWAIQQFDLGAHARVTSAQLPGGFKQRLAMAAALLHEPEILFLDEPTSGADPLARRVFWRRITALAEQGVTVIVTTHFMQEAEYCDRVAIMDSGKVLAQGSPGDIRQHASTPETLEPSMEDAFIAIVQDSRDEQAHSGAASSKVAS